MFWFDWMTLGIILGLAVVQAAGVGRAGGFALSLLQGILVCLAVFGAVSLFQPLAQALKLERWVTLAGLFIVLGVAAWFLGRFLNTLTGWSFGTFDVPMAFVFGLVTGWAIAYMVLRIIIESQGPGGTVAQNLAQAPVAGEVYWFRTWNRIMDLLFRARHSSREMWNVDQHEL